MNTRHMSRWITACVSVVAIIIAVLYVEPAQADDTEDTGSITITYQYKNSAVQDAMFYLYRVADWNESSPETPLSQMVTEDFRTAYPNVTWTLLDSQHAEEWRQLTTTLFLNMKQDGFDHVPAVAAGTTDASGIVTFPGLSDGVYLAISPLGAPPQAVYSAQLISLPINSDTEQDSRQVSVAAKPTPWNGTDPIHVRKVWNDHNAADRPSAVNVTLYYQYEENGAFEPYETVTLSDANSWSHEWTMLPESLDYTVREDTVSSGYTVSVATDYVSSDTSVWTFTNTAADSTVPTKPNGTDTTGTVVETADTVSNNTVRPALTGTDIALIALIAVCALVLGVILIMEIRNARKQPLDD